MKPLRQTTVERKSMGLKHTSRIEGESEKPMCQRLMKQRAWLLRLREDLWKGIQHLTAEACEESPHYSMHMADAATDSFDRDLVLALVSFEQEGLYEIDAALKRIEDGTYGVCELTGKAIPWERLEQFRGLAFQSRQKIRSRGMFILISVHSEGSAWLKGS